VRDRKSDTALTSAPLAVDLLGFCLRGWGYDLRGSAERRRSGGRCLDVLPSTKSSFPRLNPNFGDDFGAITWDLSPEAGKPRQIKRGYRKSPTDQ